jgi:hypothetical protein
MTSGFGRTFTAHGESESERITIEVVSKPPPVPGNLRIEEGATRWLFVPRDAWTTGDYALVVLPILEDVAGNRIGRRFEVASPGEAVAEEGKDPIAIPFLIGRSAGL